MSDLTVYGVPGSPYYRGALLALEEKSIPYRLSFLQPGAGRSPEHLSRHPFGRIPVLDHGDFRLYETQAILRYVDGLSSNNPLQPTDARATARMNQILGIVDWYFFPTITVKITAERIMSQFFWQRGPNEETIAKALPEARVCIQELDRLKGSGPYLNGSAVTLADLMLVPQLEFFSHTPEAADLLRGTGLTEWMERMQTRPSMKATERDRLVQAAA
ncbi:MAG TPA: glutathione S-transferase family protein [Steroidobacteraceae bacterium]|jgi:glutathione S-transferase